MSSHPSSNHLSEFASFAVLPGVVWLGIADDFYIAHGKPMLGQYFFGQRNFILEAIDGQAAIDRRFAIGRHFFPFQEKQDREILFDIHTSHFEILEISFIRTVTAQLGDLFQR
jgi:hypothetical protein